MTDDNFRFCLLKLMEKKTCKPTDSNICHVWTECLNHSLNVNWVLDGKQVHISETVYLKNILRINVFYLFQTFMLIQAWVSLKAEEKALGKGGIKDSGEKIVPLLPSMKTCIFEFSFPFLTLIKSVNQSCKFAAYSVSPVVPFFLHSHCWYPSLGPDPLTPRLL